MARRKQEYLLRARQQAASVRFWTLGIRRFKAEHRPAAKRLLNMETPARNHAIAAIREGSWQMLYSVLDVLFDNVVYGAYASREKARLVLAEFGDVALAVLWHRLVRTRAVSLSVKLVMTFPRLFPHLDDLTLANVHATLCAATVRTAQPKLAKAYLETRRLLDSYIAEHRSEGAFQIIAARYLAGHLAHQRAAQAKPVCQQAAVVDVQ